MTNLQTAKDVVIKASEDAEYDFEGYLSTYENIDRDGDIFLKGCFDESLKKDDTHPMLYGHEYKNPDSMLGKLKMSSDDKGLFVKAKFGTSEKARNIKEMVKMGAIKTMSVGCFIQEFEPIDPERPYAGNRVKKADIVEGSIVPVPANPEAMITFVKSVLKDEKDELEVLNFIQDLVNTTVEKAFKAHEDKIIVEKRQEIISTLKGIH